MDGVLVDNEPYWAEAKVRIFKKLFDTVEDNLAEKLLGKGPESVFQYALSKGANVSEIEFNNLFFSEGKTVYSKSALTEGIQEFGNFLVNQNVAIAIVSSSPLEWINEVKARLSFAESVSVVVSLYNHPTLATKPSPDGYTYALSKLGASASEALVIEDSNSGIQAGKASGAFTVGFKKNILPGYVQEGADAYVVEFSELTQFFNITTLL